MPYVLQKGAEYCGITNKKQVIKTQDINKATKFKKLESAKEKLAWASKKLKGFTPVEIGEIDNNVRIVKRKSFTQTERTNIYDRNHGRCAICGRYVSFTDFTVDHIIPISKGGTNSMDNLQCACKTCNLIKQDILPDDLIDKLSEIIIYQTKKSGNDKLRKKMNYIHRQKRKCKMAKVIKTLINKK